MAHYYAPCKVVTRLGNAILRVDHYLDIRTFIQDVIYPTSQLWGWLDNVRDIKYIGNQYEMHVDDYDDNGIPTKIIMVARRMPMGQTFSFDITIPDTDNVD